MGAPSAVREPKSRRQARSRRHRRPTSAPKNARKPRARAQGRAVPGPDRRTDEPCTRPGSLRSDAAAVLHPTTGLYVGEPFGYSFLWPFSQALAATITLDGIPSLKATYRSEVGARLTGFLQLDWDSDNSEEPEGAFDEHAPRLRRPVAPPTGPGGTKYYDDNEWVGIELMRVYKQTREPGSWQPAEEIMAFEMQGWEEPRASPAPAASASATNSKMRPQHDHDGPAAELGVQLYRARKNPGTSGSPCRPTNGSRHCLLLPSNMYADHIGRRGSSNRTSTATSRA